ncbi:MAG: polyprenyl synthetase family protein [Magnetovibrionaceae bacterium]
MSSFLERLQTAADQTELMLDRLLTPENSPEARLIEAMRYASLDGGKRIRPFLVLHSSDLFDVHPECAQRTAAALEMVHCYSLVHDDLPAMDDDDLRRGRPTVHKAFDEATAILVGDALLTRAFEVLAEEETHADPRVRCDLVRHLAQAAGEHGMVGGQMLDIAAESLELGMPEITRLQRLKTGMLIRFGCEAGAILGKASEHAHLALQAYAHDLGLAFQIADDILDATGDTETVGKRTGKDAEAGKATFVSLMGLERAKEQAAMLADQAAQHLEPFGASAQPLIDLAEFVVTRKT